MCRRTLATALLAATLAVAGADFRTKPETNGRVTAWLDVSIAKPKEQGVAEATVVVFVEGPPELKVEGLKINDAVSGWATSSSEPTRREGETVLWTQTVTLRQTKPGQVPLPAVEVKFREGPDAAQEAIQWPHLLREVRGLPTPVEVNEPASKASRWRAWAVIALIVANVLASVVIAVRLVRRRRPQPKLTAEQRALRELDAAMALTTSDVVTAHLRMADAVRGFFAARLQLPAPRQTTAEFLAAVGREAAVSEERQTALREFFERCDLVKFAGVRPAPEACQRTLDLARQLISPAETRNASPAAAVPTPGR